jgi:soluble lytic murein transglycosylase
VVGREPEQPVGRRSVTRGRRAAAIVAAAFLAGFLLVVVWPDRARRDDPPDLDALASKIDRAAAESRVDPALLRALVATESGGDPHARSGAGAVGLLQLMPDAAAEAAKALGIARPPDLEDPATNLRLGARHLAGLLDTFGGDVALALAAYNAGHVPVLRWRLRAPDVDGRSVVLREGYAQTRGHVVRALRFLDAYASAR